MVFTDESTYCRNLSGCCRQPNRTVKGPSVRSSHPQTPEIPPDFSRRHGAAPSSHVRGTFDPFKLRAKGRAKTTRPPKVHYISPRCDEAL